MFYGGPVNARRSALVHAGYSASARGKEVSMIPLPWTADIAIITADQGNFTADGGINLTTFMRVQAVVAGDYNGIWRDIGDVFDIVLLADLSNSTVSIVPVGNPDYPLYGWMKQVPASTPLYSYALSNGGLSTVRTSVRRWVV